MPLIKRYDHRCDYQEGERIYVENRYGKSFATVLKIIRLPLQSCDKAILEFEDPGYQERWGKERSTPYFAINCSRGAALPSYIAIDEVQPAATSLAVLPGDVPPDAPPTLTQGDYRPIVLALLDRHSTVSLAFVQATVKGSTLLGPRDWTLHPTKPKRVLWMVRLQEAIKHLKRTGMLEVAGREVYRRKIVTPHPTPVPAYPGVSHRIER